MSGMRETGCDSPWQLVKRQVFSQLMLRQKGHSPVWSNGVAGFPAVISELLPPLPFAPLWGLTWHGQFTWVQEWTEPCAQGKLGALLSLTLLLWLRRRWSIPILRSDSRDCSWSLPASLVRISALKPCWNLAFTAEWFQLLPLWEWGIPRHNLLLPMLFALWAGVVLWILSMEWPKTCGTFNEVGIRRYGFTTLLNPHEQIKNLCKFRPIGHALLNGKIQVALQQIPLTLRCLPCKFI